MCLFPSTAQTQEFGKPKLHTEGDLVLPCGKCTECISKRAIEWALRARHEISLHPENCFITLTYNDETLPSIYLVKYEFQKFIKRLRKKLKKNIRYMVSHEYGSKTFRPHHHAIIFGWNPENQKLLKTTPSGEKLFTSSELEKLWINGYSSIGSANERSAYYIASYSLKGKKNIIPDPLTGELVTVSDCMDASKRPAIGYVYFQKNIQQIIDSKLILPRYYKKRLLLENPLLHQHYEDRESSKNHKIRGSHELRAKYIIDQKNLDSEFRLKSDDSQESSHLKKQLKQNVNNYVDKIRERKK